MRCFFIFLYVQRHAVVRGDIAVLLFRAAQALRRWRRVMGKVSDYLFRMRVCKSHLFQTAKRFFIVLQAHMPPRRIALLP